MKVGGTAAGGSVTSAGARSTRLGTTRARVDEAPTVIEVAKPKTSSASVPVDDCETVDHLLAA